MNYRNRKFLDLCRDSRCFLETSDCNHDPETVVACHSNEQRHGKGMGIKAHDVFTVPGCSACHAWLDQGKAHREEKQAVWRQSWERWILHLMVSGKLEVSR